MKTKKLSPRYLYLCILLFLAIVEMISIASTGTSVKNRNTVQQIANQIVQTPRASALTKQQKKAKRKKLVAKFEGYESDIDSIYSSYYYRFASTVKTLNQIKSGTYKVSLPDGRIFSKKTCPDSVESYIEAKYEELKKSCTSYKKQTKKEYKSKVSPIVKKQEKIIKKLKKIGAKKPAKKYAKKLGYPKLK